MIVTLTTSLPFGYTHALLEMQAEACTPTKTLNGTQTAITSGTFEQQWGLDVGWSFLTVGSLTAAAKILSDQDRERKGMNPGLNSDKNVQATTNNANEITGITNSVGAAWATPTYDPAGNMAGIPNPQSLTAEYDAWNRLVSIKDGAATVSQHVYDARGYRIRKDTYTSGTLTETRHYYYTPSWQCVEERVGTSTTAQRQFVWGLRYIDDLVLRDRSTANNGVINERRYAMQGGNWNTIAICDITGFVGERYAYSAYGTPVFMTGAGIVQTSSPIGFETLYAGYRFDGATPQMYYVRNRFLLPMIGTWNKRDPLGYVDGMGLYFLSATISETDPFGNVPPHMPHGAQEARSQLKKLLLDLCESCKTNPPSGCSQRICIRDADRIAGAFFETLGNNFKEKSFYENWKGTEKYRGYFCYEWAWSFLAAFKQVGSSCFDFFFDGARVPDGNLLHAWIEIRSKCGDTNRAKVYVDDSFGNGEWINTKRPLPSGYEYDPGVIGDCNPNKPSNSDVNPPTPYCWCGKPFSRNCLTKVYPEYFEE